MKDIITPEELPIWVPGEILSCSLGLNWKDIGQRSYLYTGQEVNIPPLDHFMLVRYRQSYTPMYRKVEDAKGMQTTCMPDDISLLTSLQPSHWNWTRDVEVSHIYLSNRLLSRLAGEIMDEAVEDVHLHDKLQVKDPVLVNIANAIEAEASCQRVGGSIYAEALGIQLAVHLLRNYASIDIQEKDKMGCFTSIQRRYLEEYIYNHLHANISIEGLARELNMGDWAFSRKFRETYGRTPYNYVTTQRLEKAKKLLAGGTKPIKEIAYICGFSDQAHLTRMIRDHFKTTPSALRKSTQKKPNSYGY